MRAKKISSAEIAEIEKDSWKVLIGGISINIILGSFYAWGAYSIYLASYLRNIESSDTSSNAVLLIFPLMNISMNSMIPFGDKIVAKIGLKALVSVGILLMSMMFSILSFVSNYYLFLAVNVLVIGPLYGILYVVPFLCSWRFFPLKSGEVNATLQAGYGLGAGLFSYFAYQIVNNQNDYPMIAELGQGFNRIFFDDCLAKNTMIMLRFFAVAFAILGAFAYYFIRSQSEGMLIQYQQLEMVKQRSIKVDPKEKEKQKRMSPHQICPTLIDGIKTKQFLQLIPFAIGSSFFGYFAMAYYKVYGLTHQSSDHELTILGFVSFAFFGGSRHLWTKLINHFEFKKSFYIIILSQLAVVITLSMFSGIKLIYYASIFTLIFIQGGVFSWFSKFVPKVFGYKLTNQIFGLILIAFAFSNLLMHTLIILSKENGQIHLELVQTVSIIALSSITVAFRFFNDSPEFV